MTSKKLLRQLHFERMCLGKVHLRNLDGSHVEKIQGTIEYGSVYFHTPNKEELFSAEPDAVITYASGTTLYLYKVDDYNNDENDEKTKY